MFICGCVVNVYIIIEIVVRVLGSDGVVLEDVVWKVWVGEIFLSNVVKGFIVVGGIYVVYLNYDEVEVGLCLYVNNFVVFWVIVKGLEGFGNEVVVWIGIDVFNDRVCFFWVVVMRMYD